ncbi:MAG TPA: GNAT family N-acetyltransferase [Arenimonas sp.]|nr:GNAT family N-acetyltransferase [Arenimonas sp.]
MPDLNIERLKIYSAEDAAQLGTLMTFLSDKFTGEPIDRDLLEAIILSPYHEQLIARMKGRVVGAATLSITMGVAAGAKGYLEDFVLDPEVRGQGVADKVWEEMMRWCNEHDLDLNFTSRPSREAAQNFYKSHGASIKETLVFHVKPNRT